MIVPPGGPENATLYAKLLTLPVISSADADKIRSSGLLEVAQAYTANVMRIHTLTMLPAFVASSIWTFERAQCKIRNDLTGDPLISDEDLEAQGLRDKYIANFGDHMSGTEYWLGDVETLRRAIFTGFQLVTKLDEGSGLYGMGDGFRAIFTSSIITAWTSFESLAADLWEAAIAAKLDRTAALQGHKDRISKKATDFARRGHVENEDSPMRKVDSTLRKMASRANSESEKRFVAKSV